MTLPIWWLNSNLNMGRASAPSNLLQSLKTWLDVSKWRPAQTQDIVIRQLHDRSGTFHVLKNPRVHTYLRLSPQEYWVWERLDGTRTVQEIVVAYFQAYGSFAFGLIVGLVQQFYEKQMLQDQPKFLLSRLGRELKKRTLVHKFFDPEDGLLSRQFLIVRFDHLITRLYDAGAWVFFTRYAQVIFLVITISGIYLFNRILGDPRFHFTGRNLGVTIILLWIAAILPATLHELGHALATKHYGREVYRGGFMLYYGLPAAFVDTTDIWLENKGRRIIVALAGPLTSMLVASLFTIILWFSPEAFYAPVLFQIASIGFFISFLNLNPTLRLDGYYVLSDALEITMLRERSFAFFRRTFIQKILRRERFIRDEIIFVGFGLLTVAWIGYSIFLALFVYRVRLSQAAQSLFGTPTREFRWLITASLILIGLALIFFLRQKIFAGAKTAIGIIRRVELLSRPKVVAVLILALAEIVTFVPLALIPEAIDWFDSIVGVIAVTFALICAVRIAQDMKGTRAGSAWQIFILALGLVTISHVLWGLTFERSDSIAIVFDLIAMAMAGVAAIISAPFLLGLRSSWRAVSMILLGLGWVSLVAGQASHESLPGVALHLFSILILLGALLHWQIAPSTDIGVSHIYAHVVTTSEQLAKGFQSIAESLLEQLRITFGTGNVRRAQSDFNAASLERDWRMTFKDRNLSFIGWEEMHAADLADLLSAALSTLLRRISSIVGESFARAALARAYDALNWDERELIAEYVLNQVDYAKGLAEQFTETRHDIVSLLQRSPLFANFTVDELGLIGQQLEREHYKQGDVIIRQGDYGDRFYIIRRGRVKISYRDSEGLEQSLVELETGDYFGETSVLTHAPRTATVRAATPVSLFMLGKKSFDRLVRAGFQGRDKMDAALVRVGLLRRIPIFADFDSLELQRVAAQLESLQVEGGETILKQGDSGDKFYIIESGEVAVLTRQPTGEIVEQARLGPEEYFGEIALLMNVPRTAAVVALKPSKLLTLNAEPFNALVKQSQSVSRALERASSRRMLLISESAPRISISS